MFCFRRAFSHHVFAGLVFVRTTYEYIRAFCRRISTTTTTYRKHRKHNTIQHSAVNPRNKQQSKYAPYQSATTQASRPSWLAAACCRAYIQLDVLKTNKEIELCSAIKKLLVCCAKGLPVHCSFSPSFLFRPCVRRPGCFGGPWSSWHLQVASLHRKPWTSLCDSVTRILFNSL